MTATAPAAPHAPARHVPVLDALDEIEAQIALHARIPGVFIDCVALPCADGVRLDRFVVLPSGNGYGSWLMEAICAILDRRGLALRLPLHLDPRTPEARRLLAWAARHGLERDADGLVRRPRAAA